MIFYKHLAVSTEIKNGVIICETYRRDIDDEAFDTFTIPNEISPDDWEEYVKSYIDNNYLN
jgi:hypothetical protein